MNLEELIACVAEIHSDLGFVMDCGFDSDTISEIKSLYHRTGELLNADYSYLFDKKGVK